MKIIIAGGTGFIGSFLVPTLVSAGNSVVLLTRSTQKNVTSNVRFVQWDGHSKSSGLEKEIDGSDAVINLAGRNIAEKRWSNSFKREILESRVHTTRTLAETICNVRQKPSVFISGSASGFYGNGGESLLTEQSPSGKDFLAEVCAAWESESHKVDKCGVRVVNPRIGVVLEKSGGALEKILLPFRFFVGGHFGNGQQYFPWVAMEDVVRALIFPLEKTSFSGAYNIAAPQTVRMEEFCTVLSQKIQRPSWLPIPAFALKIALGEFAETFIGSQKVAPQALILAGFEFKFPVLEKFLATLG